MQPRSGHDLNGELHAGLQPHLPSSVLIDTPMARHGATVRNLSSRSIIRTDENTLWLSCIDIFSVCYMELDILEAMPILDPIRMRRKMEIANFLPTVGTGFRLGGPQKRARKLHSKEVVMRLPWRLAL